MKFKYKKIPPEVQKLLRKPAVIVAITVVLISLVVPVFFLKNFETLKNIGYIGFFIANYFGYGVYLLPFLLKELNPMILIIIGAIGSTIDEFFAWYIGKNTTEFEHKSKTHELTHRFIKKYGVMGAFAMAILPFPGFLFAIAGFAAGHYGIKYPQFFLAGFAGRLVRYTTYTIAILHVLDKYNWLQ